MTPEEKKQKRNEYAKAYYAKNKDKMKTARAAKKTGSKEAINPKLGVERNVEKLAERTVSKGAKIISTAETLVKAMGDVLSEAYRAKSQELVDRVIKMFTKKLNAEITEDDGTKLYLSVDLGTRTVRIPKAMQKQPAETPDTAADAEPTMEELKAIDEDVEAAMPDEHPEEILADVSVINALREGTVTEADIERANDEYPDVDDEDLDDEVDEDELDEDERAEREYERDIEGRSEMFREFDAQGAYDD